MNTNQFIEYAERELQRPPGRFLTMVCKVSRQPIYYLDKNGWRWEFNNDTWRILGRG